jgi:hypothetical protein
MLDSPSIDFIVQNTMNQVHWKKNYLLCEGPFLWPISGSMEITLIAGQSIVRTSSKSQAEFGLFRFEFRRPMSRQ